MKCQREKFQIPRKVSYINCAYMAPVMKKVERVGRFAIAKKRKPYLIHPEDFFHESNTLRLVYSTLINNKQPERVVIIPSVSYGMANAANNLKKKSGKIIVADEQFPSNVYPWKNLENYTIESIGPGDFPNRGKQWNEKILRAIDENTAAVAIGHVHWVDGTVFDLKRIREKTKKVGSALIIDGTQSVGALPFDCADLQPDALICAGYKWLMGPYSIGLAYYGSYFDHGKPIENNWISRLHSENFGGLVNYQENYQPGALRYEVGERSNFTLVPMMIEAIKQLNHWTPEAIQRYCGELLDPIMPHLKSMGYQIEMPENRSNHLVGVRVPEGTDIDEIRNKLLKSKVFVSIRSNAIRIAPNVYNDTRDMNRLLNCLKI